MGEILKYRHKFRGLATLVACLIVIPTGVAWGSSTKTGSSTANPNTVYAPGVPTLNQLLKGSSTEPPTTGPTAFKGTVNIAFVSCGTSIPCTTMAASAAGAAKVLGWNYQVFQASAASSGVQVAMSAAIATNPTAIIAAGINCNQMIPQLQQAQQAKIPVISDGLDCNSPTNAPNTSPSLYSIPLIMNKSTPTMDAWWKFVGAAEAEYVIDATKGKAKVILDPYNTGFGIDMLESWKAELAKCKQCKIVDSVSWTTSDTTSQLTQMFATALAKNPNANSVIFPFDYNAVGAGGANAIVNAGERLKIISVSGEDTTPALALIKEGRGLTAEPAANSFDYRAWAIMDEINRYLNGDKSVPEGVGVIAINKSNLTARTSPSNFVAEYTKIWKG
jgi:ABC-type sugar transport system substrate-binding protein